MDHDITLNSIAFKLTFNERAGSERQSTTRGVNTPDLMVIKHQDARDNTYKVDTKRHLLRIDRVDQDSEGLAYATSAYLVVVVPEKATTAQVDDVIATMRAAVASTTPDYLEQLLNNER